MDLLTALVQVAALPHEKVRQTIELLAKYVMRKIKDGASSQSAAAGRLIE